MAQAGRDQNFVPTLLGVSNVDGTTPIAVYADPTTHRLLTDAASGGGTVTSVSVVTANGFAGTVATSTTTPAITLTTTLTTPVIAGNGTALIAATTTGTGSTVVLQGTPTLTTPVIGVATGTSLAVTGILTAGTNGGTNGSLKLFGSTSGDVTIKTAAIAGTATIFQLPATNGSNTNVLQTDGAGVTSWVAAGTGTVTAVSVASSNGFAGSSSGGATPILTLTTSITGVLKGNSTAISAATAGSDYAVGSIGLAGGQTIAGSTLTLENLTLRANAADLTTGAVIVTSSKEASSSTVGSVQLAGGLAVAKRVYALDMTVTNTITGSVSGNAGTATAVAVGGITGLGTGVATALAVNVGSAGAFVTFNGALGTPSSGTLTNATGLPVAGITASTSTALGVGSIELGAASDTTIARVSAGIISVEGVRVQTTTPLIVATTSYTTDTGTSLNMDNLDIFVITAQAGALLFNSPGGTLVQGRSLIIRIKDNGTARALTWNSVFRAMGTALPSTTVLSKTLYLGFFYNSTDTKWDLVASAQEA